MSFLGHSRKLLSPVFKSSLLPEQAGVLRSVCSLHAARLLRTRCLPRPLAAQPPPCPRWRHVFTCRSDTYRCFSDGDGGHSAERAGVLEEEPQEVERDSSLQSRQSPQTFTLDVLVSLLRQENAVDICVIKVPEQIKYTEFFIVASGVSPRHLRAMALYAVKVYKFLKKDGDPNVKIEGKDAEDWMCIDFGNMVVHFMLPETREVYELEKLWTLRAYDEQLKSMPVETLPEDFIYDVEITK